MLREVDPNYITVDLVQAMEMCKKGQTVKACQNLDKFIAKLDNLLEEIDAHLAELENQKESPAATEHPSKDEK